MTKLEIEKNLNEVVNILKKNYSDLELDYYFNSKFGVYELIFFGERYEYNDGFWCMADKCIFQRFTSNNTYISYYYTDSFHEKIRDNKNIAIENQKKLTSFSDYDLSVEC